MPSSSKRQSDDLQAISDELNKKHRRKAGGDESSDSEVDMSDGESEDDSNPSDDEGVDGSPGDDAESLPVILHGMGRDAMADGDGCRGVDGAGTSGDDKALKVIPQAICFGL
jgi:hypothetical protein